MCDRIICPRLTLDKQERIAYVLENTLAWSKSKHIIELVNIFDGDAEAHINSDKGYIDWLHEFVKVWDYRLKQSGGGERWTIYDDDFILKNEEKIMVNASCLGLVEVTDVKFEPDYILPLGGARQTNLDRPKMAKYIIDKNSWKGKKIIALSGRRPINEIERPVVKEYAPDAVTEFDAINVGLEISFEIGKSYKDDIIDHTNINLSSCLRKYNERYRDSSIFSLAAPSSEPEKRRANSYDTFVYFLEKFNVERGSKLLLVTSSIYVPFQLLKFIDLAVEFDLEVDCIGTDSVNERSKFSRPSNYLQEIKSTVDAIHSLWNRYA